MGPIDDKSWEEHVKLVNERREKLYEQESWARDGDTYEPTQDDVNEKLFEAIKLTVEKFGRKVEEQSTANKLIELSIDIMGSKLLHKEKVLTERLNAVSIREEAILNSLDNIDESLAQMYNRIKHLEKVVEGLEFVQGNKQCCNERVNNGG